MQRSKQGGPHSQIPYNTLMWHVASRHARDLRAPIQNAAVHLQRQARVAYEANQSLLFELLQSWERFFHDLCNQRLQLILVH